MVPEAAAAGASSPGSIRRTSEMLLASMLAIAAATESGTVEGADAGSQSLRASVARLRTERAVRVDDAEIAARRLIAAFYERRDFRPAWSRPGRAEALAAAIEESRSHGLDPRDYHAATVRRLASGATPELDEADRELLLTDALVRLAYHLHFGKANPRELYPGWNFTRSLGAVDPVAALEAIVASPALGEALERYAPRLPAYRRLREALARYRTIEASGGWPQIGPGATLEPGASDPRVAALRERLTVSGDIEHGSGEPARFDRRSRQRCATSRAGTVSRPTASWVAGRSRRSMPASRGASSSSE